MQHIAKKWCVTGLAILLMATMLPACGKKETAVEEEQAVTEESGIQENGKYALYDKDDVKLLEFTMPEGFEVTDDRKKGMLFIGKDNISICMYELPKLEELYNSSEEEFVMTFDSESEDPQEDYYYYKEDVETVYGTGKCYLEVIDGEEFGTEVVVLKVNGRYIVIDYDDYDTYGNTDYTGKLKELVETEMFV